MRRTTDHSRGASCRVRRPTGSGSGLPQADARTVAARWRRCGRTCRRRPRSRWVRPRPPVRAARAASGATGRSSRDRRAHRRPTRSARPARAHLGDRAEAAVGDDGGVPRLGADRRGERAVVANIGMDVAVPVDLGEFVTAGVADRDVVAALGEAGHNGRPRWSRPSDDEGLHAVAVMVTRRRRSLGRDIGELIAQHPLEHLARGVAGITSTNSTFLGCLKRASLPDT